MQYTIFVTLFFFLGEYVRRKEKHGSLWPCIQPFILKSAYFKWGNYFTFVKNNVSVEGTDTESTPMQRMCPIIF